MLPLGLWKSSLAFYPEDDVVFSTSRKIRSFQNLKKGWHYGEGAAVHAETIRKALELNEKAINLGFLNTDAFPGLDGEVRITVYDDAEYYEFTISASGSVEYIRETGDDEIESEEELDFGEALDRLKRAAERALSDLSIQATTIKERRDFKVWHLSRRTGTEASPSSISIALKMGEEPFVSTSTYTILLSQAIHRSSGS
jgi:hypothetical protein